MRRAGTARGYLARLGADARGATAVEFALIALPLLLLILVLLDIALMFWMGHALDNAVEVGARKVATNTLSAQEGGQGDPAGRLKQEICDSITPLLNCETVRIDMTAFASLRDANVVHPIDPATRDWRAGFGSRYECPRDGGIVVLQAAFAFASFSGFSFGHAELSNGNRVAQSAYTFRVEDGLEAGCAAAP